MNIYERRKPLTDLQIKNRLSKLPILEQFDFLHGSDILLDRESEITLDLLAELRGHIHNALINIRNELLSDDLATEENAEEKPLPFDTTTRLGQRLARVAKVFIDSLKRPQTDSSIINHGAKYTSREALSESPSEIKFVNEQKTLRNKKSGKFANLVTSLQQKKQLAAVQSNNLPVLPEHEQDKQARSYLKEKLFDDLTDAAKREQEILMEKMKLQAMRFTSESVRQQDKVDMRINKAKGSKKKINDMPTDVAISQLLDRSHQLNEIYVKDREEHETALTVRIQQEQQLKSDHKYPRDDGKLIGNKSNQLDNKRFKMKRPLPALGCEMGHVEHEVESTERKQQQEDDEKLSEKKSKRLDNKQSKLKRPLPHLEDSDNQGEGSNGKNL
ncbi:hypothetical protein MN116_007629 [Schistosoma mekongi]|uniref:Uncharacterized protein n=1 Tax=Schistosoma mekongi TaxID=38744 RepID=A0AAE1Z6D2_SCHME|nr:hypothetical protein MN116_007629 [Schistosoma mekongi]